MEANDFLLQIITTSTFKHCFTLGSGKAQISNTINERKRSASAMTTASCNDDVFMIANAFRKACVSWLVCFYSNSVVKTFAVVDVVVTVEVSHL